MLLSIIAVVISVVSYLRVDHIQQMMDEIEPLEIEIRIQKPENHTEIFHYVVEVTGQISLKHDLGRKGITDVNIELSRRKIDLIPFVRPLSEANLWYAQTRLAIGRNGYFQGSVNLGTKEGDGVGIDFQIVILAVPINTVSQGRTYRDLPPYGSASRIITVTRRE